MSALLVLDDSAIRRMLNTPTIVSAFPFLRHAAARLQSESTSKGGCKPCQRRKQRANVGDYEGVRSAIGSLSVADKAKLKQLLGAEQVRVYFTNPKRQRVKMTF